MMTDMPGGYAQLRVHDDGRITPVYVNEGYCRLTSMSHDEVMRIFAENSLSGIHPEDRAAVSEGIAFMLQNREMLQIRCRLRYGDGDFIWVNIFSSVTTDIDGNTFINSYYVDAREQVMDEERQKTLLDNLPGGAGIYTFSNGEMQLVYQNKNFYNLIGVSAGVHPESKLMSAIHPDDISMLKQELSLAISQKHDVSCDVMMTHLTEGYRLVHISARVVPKIEGEFLIYASFTPIAGESETYQQMIPLVLSAILDSTSDLSFTKDINFRYLSASRSFANMVGYESIAEIIGKTDYELFNKEMADKFRQDDVELLAGGEAIVDMIESIVPMNGLPRYSSTSKYILKGSDGQDVGIYGIGRDVTNIIEQKNRLSLMANSIQGGLASYACTEGDFSPENIKIVYFNDGFCKLFGFTREEYLEHASADPAGMVFEEDREILAEQWASLMKGNTPMTCKYRVHTKDGAYKWISLKAVITDCSKDTIVADAIILDVT